MVTDFIFTKYKDKYILKNLSTTTLLAYILRVRESCGDTYKIVTDYTLVPISTNIEINLPNDGDYELYLARGDTDTETVLFKSYLRLQKAFIQNFLTIICGSNNNCQGCADNPLSLREQQAMFNQILTYNFLMITPNTEYCGGDCLFSGFTQQAIELSSCSLKEKVYWNLNKELQSGKTEVESALETTLTYASIYYLTYYFYEDLLAVDEEEKTYVNKKFNYDVAKICTSKYINCIDDLRSVFLNQTTDCNEAPTVNSIVKLFSDFTPGANQDVYIFQPIDFSTGFFDSNGDLPGMVTILSNTFNGVLSYNGTPIPNNNFPFQFSIANANLLRYTYTILTSSANFDKIFFQVADNNPTPKKSNMATITINTEAYVNQPPSEVGDNTFNLANRAVKVFTVADFTTGTTPAYADPENDPIDALRIDSLPADGVLKLSGTNCTVGQIIAVASINAGLFSYTSPNQNAADNDTWTFSVRDTGSGQFAS